MGAEYRHEQDKQFAEEAVGSLMEPPELPFIPMFIQLLFPDYLSPMPTINNSVQLLKSGATSCLTLSLPNT